MEMMRNSQVISHKFNVDDEEYVRFNTGKSKRATIMTIYYHQIKLNEWFSSSVRKPSFNLISTSSVAIYVISGTKMSLRDYA